MKTAKAWAIAADTGHLMIWSIRVSKKSAIECAEERWPCTNWRQLRKHGYRAVKVEIIPRPTGGGQ